MGEGGKEGDGRGGEGEEEREGGGREGETRREGGRETRGKKMTMKMSHDSQCKLT